MLLVSRSHTEGAPAPVSGWEWGARRARPRGAAQGLGREQLPGGPSWPRGQPGSQQGQCGSILPETKTHNSTSAPNLPGDRRGKRLGPSSRESPSLPTCLQGT